MTTTTAASTTASSITAASAAVPAPSLTDQIHAIKQVQLTYAGKISTQCYALTSKASAIVMSDLVTNTEILAGLDVALGLLEANVQAAI
ncbi:hypothetical protein [Lichenifustis flavocetrariae]|uniref:Uncharacterized protein n=1 Tax=Lichenifustis flavocetrariae TaxID=2949735 RepID=A0AA41Z0H1_9HYPH|nr:hypothetical protein [Lichenifustis flavocetrariae]MCW6508200.1 hypothetical protein [Lichenifustis flavocetrariae]